MMFWLGLAALPALLIAAAIVYSAWAAALWAYHEWFDPSRTDRRHAYAYQVTSATGHLAQRLIGATFIESRYRGKEYTYRIEFNGVEKVRLTAKYKGHGDGFGTWASWDNGTAEELDKTPGGSDR
jgi:hypothetical protein